MVPDGVAPGRIERQRPCRIHLPSRKAATILMVGQALGVVSQLGASNTARPTVRLKTKENGKPTARMSAHKKV